MHPKKEFYAKQAHTVIKAMEKRNITGHYVETADEARELVSSMIPDGTTVGSGGSMTLTQTGILDVLRERDLTLMERSQAKTPVAMEQFHRDTFSVDYYLMGSNAITLDGKLVNVDGTGNRVAAMIYGPRKVIIVAGMNKVAPDEASAIQRVRTFAAPPNTMRLGKNTPCVETGKCHHCLAEDCICCQTVVTRMSKPKDRIHVVLVGEELGF
ncbi:lactate utilization protein [Anaerotalea alkaliphila]|uniref:Lactate utilization protein n=1 Tax=Anaerotalea alkaliphila TaxID=2662126 RepID=A0A7X5HVV3_9FIRM|nr:lactate utilization protein [Anaerotalea alkaliphila]NDL67612.1 lactate utilization protein [Anaerotalea alkaliphila]